MAPGSSSSSLSSFRHVNRQLPHVTTKTLTRQPVTYATLITVASAATQPAVSKPPSLPTPSQDEVQMSGAQLGAILGSVVAAVFIIIVVGVCCAGRRSSASSSRSGRFYDSSTNSSSSSTGPAVAQDPLPPSPQFIPGGPEAPAYTAIPIPNPRDPPPLRRVYE